jgi:hypothetical protein
VRSHSAIDVLGIEFSISFCEQVKTIRQAFKRALRLDEHRMAFAAEFVKTLGTSPTLGGGITVTSFHEGLLFESIESRVEGAGRYFAPRAQRDLPANAHAVRFVAKSKNSKEDRLFKLTESWPHINYFVVII